MVHKVKDNARILFLVSVLSAVILTAKATLNVFYSGSKDQLVEHMPQSIGYVEDSLSKHTVADPEEVKRIIREHGLTLAYELLIGVFISVLFFLASGSLLFFKLFTEFQEDQAQMVAIKRMGLTPKEQKKIVSTQIGVLFYVPCVVGAIHAAFAMKALGNVMMANVWIYAGLVLLLYLALQTVYFLTARRTYLKRLKQVTLA